MRTFADLQNRVFTPTCAQGGCHDATTQSGELDLSSVAVSHGQLVSVLSSCAGKVRVVPNDPANSYLLDKLGAGEEPCGSIMPQLAPRLSAEQIDFIISWIEAGAPTADEPVSFAAHLVPAAPVGDDREPRRR